MAEQGMTAANVSGELIQGAATAADPTYLEGKIHPLSVTLAGYLRVILGTGGATITTKEVRAATGVQTIVASSASSVPVLALNANRLGATVFNDSTSILYLLLVTGGTASATVYTVQIAANSYYEVPFNYTGALVGIWSSANGNARVTEFTA